MLSIEEYIARRKKEDYINELNYDSRLENMRVIVNYVFEYFNNYLDITESEEQTALNDERVNKFKNQLQNYSIEIQNWLVDIYNEHDRKLNVSIGNIVKKDDFFLLYNTDSEFRGLSYDCYAQLIKKHPFLKDQTEKLFLFIKEHHYLISQPSQDFNSFFITDEIDDWIKSTWDKYHVNVLAFSSNWVNRFYDNEDMWSAKHKKRSQDSWRKYEYDFKQKTNLFNLDFLYRRMPKKPFTRGKKQEFEILMMYYWLHQLEGDDEGYWDEYINKTILP